MICLFRIDYRLLHWQTGVAWPQNLKVNTIIVANDAVASNEQRKALMTVMGIAKGIELHFMSINQTISFLKTEENREKRIELLVDNSYDARILVEKGVETNVINAAFMKIAPGKRAVNKSLAFGDDDVENFRLILDKGIAIEYYTVPNEKPVSIKKYL